MSYEAIICKVTNVRDHPNADRLNIAVASGYQVIVGKDVQEGTVGIFFPPDGKLTPDMLKENNLYRHSVFNKDPEAKAGFFDDNGRVRAQTLRKAKSEGFWTELSILEWTGVDTSTLKVGHTFTEIKGHKICEKYYTKATRMARAAGQGKTSKRSLLKASFPDFKEHWSTSKLRMMIQFIPEGAVLSITEKCHGTSGRTGRLYQNIKLPWYKKMFYGLFGFTSNAERKYEYVSGTRRVVLDTTKPEVGFYEGTDFRNKIHNQIVKAGIHPGETIYYEIVGYNDQGAAIMGNHSLKEHKDLKKLYGDSMVYSYGCVTQQDHVTDGEWTNTQWKVLVYRITRTLDDGSRFEVPYHQVVARCKELELDYVPVLKEPFIYDGDQDALMETCKLLSEGASTLDAGHIREGVVVRLEAPGMDTNYKYKGYDFCDLEGIKKNDETYVDPEEVA